MLLQSTRIELSGYTLPCIYLHCRARQTLPAMFDVVDCEFYCDVVSKDVVAARTRFGPLVAKSSPEPITPTRGRLELEVCVWAQSVQAK